ncbi:MAG: CAP domain-containing protein, partial [Bacillota bacterium]
DPNIANALSYFQVDPEVLRTQWAALAPVGPLAWNSNLNTAASGHNAQMIAHDQQAHQLPGEPDFATRFKNANYQYSFAGENVFAYAENIFQGHAAFAIDWGNDTDGIQNPPGHRNNLMNPNFREVGISIAIENDAATQVGPVVVTQDFGSRKGITFITGVIYNDTITPDNFYTPGEGLGNVTVTAYQAGTSTLVASTPTYSSGGYALRLNPGVYDVKITGNGLAAPITYRNVAIYTNNVKIDSLSTWMADADGCWSNVANWSSGVPNGSGATASFYNAITAPRTISLDSPVSVGTLNLENPHGYTLEGSSSLTLESAGQSRINVIGTGSHTIKAFQVTAINTTIDIAAGASLTINSPLLIGGTLTRSGAGTLRLANLPTLNSTPPSLILDGGTTHFTTRSRLDSLAVNNTLTEAHLDATQEIHKLAIAGGTVSLTPGGSKALFADQLSITDGQLDVGDNMLVIAATASTQQQVLQSISDLVRSGQSELWTGDGIVSSAARLTATKITGLVVIPNTNGTPGVPLFDTIDGRLVSATSILVKYSFNGDINLDGMIDGDDYFQIDSGFIAKQSGYHNGDFNFDGIIDGDDYFLIDSAFIGQSNITIPKVVNAMFTVEVPEPAATSLLLSATLLLLTHRPTRSGNKKSTNLH